MLVFRDIQGIGKTTLTHASRYQTNPINLNAQVNNKSIRLEFSVMTLGLA